MQAIKIIPKIHLFDTFKEFSDEFMLGEKDVVLTNTWLYEPYMKPLGIDKVNYIFQEKFGAGEPTDVMMDQIYEEMKKYDYDRIIAFGGGTIIDIAKVLSLKVTGPVEDLFQGKVPPQKDKQLIIIPTTCGTGSEVTNVTIAHLHSIDVKKGLANDEMYADHAVLIPETLKGLPYPFFVTSSIDALIHCAESFLSPKANEFSQMFSLKGIEMIMKAYRQIIDKGEEERFNHFRELLIASNFGGIAFGYAGCAAVHALSYSIGGAFHVAHGEANYQFFTEVFKLYAQKQPSGKITQISEIFAQILGCKPEEDVYGKLEAFLGKLINKKPLSEYGMSKAQIQEFTASTIENQQRLLANNYVPLSEEDIKGIFTRLY